ncbi:LytR/AlgR family response regulator transcription factor [Flavobacterium aurantiibacter]|uniref:DNA-binding response regulator n=1 Tax=Flavobacterium aurantiibacter TaxID=2023067 RepID=A0A255ZPL7_9FLAO|nr:LytTR family DNA-binding domain-containing protein [Flavobacterium aurantiibacter]OYQ43448.1 DNA-binding response regulator [Flavobacterium aurantiibacter]
MKLNCVIVDDSAIQRMVVNKHVSNSLHLKLVGEFSNAIEAKNFMSYNEVDLIFLDIEMPVINGFDLLDGLKKKPQVIFITSKPDYAVKAFDYDATDYLQKPITNARFDAAIRRALQQYSLLKDAPEEDGTHIFIKSKLKKLKVFTNRIKYVEAYGDYIKVITDDETHLVLSTMKSFENDLPSERFVRVHKSFIVNIDKVEKFNSKYAEIGAIKIPLSRNKKDDLKRALSLT